MLTNEGKSRSHAGTIEATESGDWGALGEDLGISKEYRKDSLRLEFL